MEAPIDQIIEVAYRTPGISVLDADLSDVFTKKIGAAVYSTPRPQPIVGPRRRKNLLVILGKVRAKDDKNKRKYAGRFAVVLTNEPNSGGWAYVQLLNQRKPIPWRNHRWTEVTPDMEAVIRGMSDKSNASELFQLAVSNSKKDKEMLKEHLGHISLSSMSRILPILTRFDPEIYKGTVAEGVGNLQNKLLGCAIGNDFDMVLGMAATGDMRFMTATKKAPMKLEAAARTGMLDHPYKSNTILDSLLSTNAEEGSRNFISEQDMKTALKSAAIEGNTRSVDILLSYDYVKSDKRAVMEAMLSAAEYGYESAASRLAKELGRALPPIGKQPSWTPEPVSYEKNTLPKFEVEAEEDEEEEKKAVEEAYERGRAEAAAEFERQLAAAEAAAFERGREDAFGGEGAFGAEKAFPSPPEAPFPPGAAKEEVSDIVFALPPPPPGAPPPPPGAPPPPPPSSSGGGLKIKKKVNEKQKKLTGDYIAAKETVNNDEELSADEKKVELKILQRDYKIDMLKADPKVAKIKTLLKAKVMEEELNYDISELKSKTDLTDEEQKKLEEKESKLDLYIRVQKAFLTNNPPLIQEMQAQNILLNREKKIEEESEAAYEAQKRNAKEAMEAMASSVEEEEEKSLETIVKEGREFKHKPLYWIWNNSYTDRWPPSNLLGVERKAYEEAQRLALAAETYEELNPPVSLIVLTSGTRDDKDVYVTRKVQWAKWRKAKMGAEYEEMEKNPSMQTDVFKEIQSILEAEEGRLKGAAARGAFTASLKKVGDQMSPFGKTYKPDLFF